MRDLEEDLTLTVQSVQQRRERSEERAYLLVFDATSSTKVVLPPGGEVVIGRAPEAHVRIDDASVSRQHAKILIAGNTAQIVDLDSHNGTRVNGELVKGSRLLTSGDAIAIATSPPMVFYRDPGAAEVRAILDPQAFRARLEEELERALRYKSTFAVLALHATSQRRGPRVDLVTSLAGKLRLMDVVAKLGDDRFALLLPELGPEEAAKVAEGVFTALGARLATAGLAMCPTDGCDADSLLAGARAAAGIASPGSLRSAADAFVTRDITLELSVTLADPAMIRAFDLLEKLAPSDVAVLITGETGSGKEIAATALHHWSRRARGPLVALNCAAIPENLVESELFGYEKGAFSGALTSKAGLLESASGGTVFLDEVGELPAQVQAKLLRVLETRRLTRLGDLRERPIDIRVACATHKNLDEEVKAGRFRQDLLYRLNTAKLVLPPLRHRPRELPLLARKFLSDACQRSGREPLEISPAAMRTLLTHPWPGNVRELKNVLEFVAATATGSTVEPWHLPEAVSGIDPHAPDDDVTQQGERRQFRPIDDEVRELERRRMAEALEASGGVQTRAAELISMPLRTFVTKLKLYNLSARSGGRR